MEPDLTHAVAALSDRRRILVFTGAGISTGSGIPDFRGEGGLWSRIDPNDYRIDRHLGDAAFRRSTWGRHLDPPFLGAEPNAAHHAVTRLWRSGRAVGCVTQNVDGLHADAGFPSEHLVELHGNATKVVCVACGERTPIGDVRDRWRAGEEDPSCVRCGGVLKPDVVFFGEELPRGALLTAWAMADDADAVLVVGSSLSVYPAAHIPMDIAMSGRPMVIVNRGETEHDAAATAIVDGDATRILPELVAALTDAG